MLNRLFITALIVLSLQPVLAENVFDLKPKIKVILEGQLSKILKKQVKIDSLEGNLYRKLVLNKVSVTQGDTVLAYSDKIEIRYSLKQIVLEKFDVISNLSQIKIYYPYIAAERDASGLWNWQGETSEQKKAPADNFSGKFKIIIINGRGKYSDARGWNATGLNGKFQTELSNINAEINVKNEYVSFDTRALVPGVKKFNSLAVTGNVDMVTGRVVCGIKTSELNLKMIQEYIYPSEEFSLNGLADINCSVSYDDSAKYPALQGAVALKKLFFKSAKYPQYALDQAQASLTLTPTKLTINNFAGVVAHQKVSAAGTIADYFSKNIYYDLALQGDSVALSLITSNISGRADIKCRVSGPYSDLDIKGAAVADSIKYQNFSVKKTIVDFNYSEQVLNLILASKEFMGGRADGKITLKQKNKPNRISGEIALSDCNSAVFATSNIPIEGNFDARVLLNGELGDLNIAAKIKSSEFLLYKQKISEIKLNALLKKESLTLGKAMVKVNGEEFIFKASTDYKSFNFTVEDQPLRFRFEQLVPSYNGVTDLNLVLRGTASGNFKTLKETLKADLDILAGASLIAGETVTSARTKFTAADGLWQAAADLRMPTSAVVCDISYYPQTNDVLLTIDPQTKLALADCAFIQKYFPESKGYISSQGKIKIEKNEFGCDVTVNINDCRYEEISIDKAVVNLSFDRGIYDVKNYQILLDDNLFFGSGYWYWDKTKGTTPLLNSSESRFVLKTNDSKIEKLVELFANIQARRKDFVSRFKTTTLAAAQVDKIDQVRLPSPEEQVLYGGLAEKNILTQYKESIVTPGEVAQKKKVSKIAGSLTGMMAFENNYGDIKLSTDFTVQNGGFDDNQFDMLRCEIKTTGNTIALESSVKNLLLSGDLRYDEINANIELKDGFLNIKKVDLQKKGVVSQDLIRGTFPLFALWDRKYYERSIDLRFKMAGDDISLFSGYLKNINYIKNRGEIIARLKGTYKEPVFLTEKMDLQGLEVSIDNPNYQNLLVKRAQLGVSNNRLDINNLELVLSNEADSTPLLKFAGSVDLSGWSFVPKDALVVKTKLLLKDTEGEINLKNIYTGSFELRNVSYVGDLVIPLSAEERAKAKMKIAANAETGPLLTGSLNLYSGNLYIMKLEKEVSVKSDKYLSTLLDIDINLKKDLRVLSKDSILSSDFSNFLSQINISFRDENPQIKLGGSLNYFRLNGRVYFDEGYVSFINRKFSLLNKSEQDKYLSSTQRRSMDNYLEFRETEKFILDPVFSLTAQTTVYESVAATGNEVSENETVYSQVENDYLVNIDGSIFNLSSFTFEKYTKKSTNSYSLVGEPYIIKDKNTGKMIDPYRFQELTYDISPSFVKAAFSQFGGGAQYTGDVSKELARDITVTEVNLFVRSVMKPVERTIAKGTGLYDIRFRRDFGSDVANRLNLEGQQVLSTQEALPVEHVLGMEMVKEIAKDKVFLTVDTNIDKNIQSEKLNLMVYSYKLTWKIVRDLLLDEISLNYGNELDIYQSQYIPVLSLEGLHSF